MNYPFSQLNHGQLRRLFFIFLVATIGLALVMNNIGGPLKTVQSPAGIVTFEFSWTVTGAQTILNNWDESAKIHAAFIQGLDYLFLMVYAQAFALACLLAGRRLGNRGWIGSSWGGALAWGMWLAAILDAVENFALVVLLFGSVNEPWPLIAGVCATAKFTLLGGGLLYSLAGWAAGFLQPKQS